MEQFTFKGHTVTVIESAYYGKSIFIRNAEGEQIYAHRFTGSAMDRAVMVLGAEEVKAVTVAASVAPVVNNAVHTTNDGRKIALVNLTDDHLIAILPKVRYSIRRFLYVQEAKRRGIYQYEPSPVEVYQARMSRQLQAA